MSAVAEEVGRVAANQLGRAHPGPAPAPVRGRAAQGTGDVGSGVQGRSEVRCGAGMGVDFSHGGGV
jgi:hypothetical protein